ncbi:hypothetical protein ACP4OV_011829 [Aristida adscensionis]
MAGLMAGLVGSAIAQEVVSKAFSSVLDQREEKASQEHNIERLEMAHTELEFALERSSKFPLTDASLLRRRKILKHALGECGNVLYRSKRRVLEDQDMEQMVMATDSSLHGRIVRATKSSIACLFTKKKDEGLCCSDVRRFEWFAACARNFVRDVETGCSLRHHTFCSPLLRQLLQGKTLGYRRLQGSRLRHIYIWPICLEERGVEAQLSYHYENYKMPGRSFHLWFMLRLSESTDIVGIAIKCLRYVASQFKLIAESAIRELTLLPDLPGISYSYGPPWDGIQESHALLSQVCRPDPLCCKLSGHETCGNNGTTELSFKFSEQVILVSFQYYASAIEYNLHGSIDQAGRNNLIDSSSPLLLLRAGFAPHGTWDVVMQNNKITTFGKRELRDGSVEEEIEMIRSKTIGCLVLQPQLADYITPWKYAHGFAFFHVLTSKSKWLVSPEPTGYSYSRSITMRSRKRKAVEV